jgi:hypothetical protein
VSRYFDSALPKAQMAPSAHAILASAGVYLHINASGGRSHGS